MTELLYPNLNPFWKTAALIKYVVVINNTPDTSIVYVASDFSKKNGSFIFRFIQNKKYTQGALF
jgi:hypothetical protein